VKSFAPGLELTSLPSVTVFDLAGVVCDFEPELRLSGLARLSRLPESEVQARLFDSGFSADCDAGKYSGREAFSSVCAALHIRPLYERFLEFWSSAFVPRSDVLEIIDEVHRLTTTALFTNNGPFLLDAFQRHLPEINRRFDRLLFSFELGCVKPDPRAFDRAAAMLECRPAKLLFFDDSAANIHAAAEQGWRAYLYSDIEILWRDLKRFKNL
jgi:glucose-1-phosphatase